jgi:hypothetical protein
MDYRLNQPYRDFGTLRLSDGLDTGAARAATWVDLGLARLQRAPRK